MRQYLKIWRILATNSLQESLNHRTTSLIFITAKFIRFFIFLGFIISLTSYSQTLGHFSQQQLIIHYLVFNMFDLIGQLFFRGIYMFKPEIISGEFDFKLTKPKHSLFLVLARRFDVLDLPLLITTITAFIIMAFPINPLQLAHLFIASIAAFVLISAVHILIAAIYVYAESVDHLVDVYRYTSSLARFPTAIYHDTLRAFLTIVIPVTLIFNLPAQAILGSINTSTLVIIASTATITCWMSVKIWNVALRHYTSASS